MSIVLIVFICIFVLGPIARAYAKRIDRELPPEASRALLEVDELRGQLERLTAQVDQLQEEQSFMVKLLAESERRELTSGPDTE